MEVNVKVLISEEEVKEKVREIAEQINADYAGKELHVVCILQGGVFFMCELVKHITVPVTHDFMSVSSYGDGTVSTGRIKILKDMDECIEGKDVLIVEDILDTGNTLYYLMQMLKLRQPASIRICTLMDKPERRKKPIVADYIGFTIPDAFVVGYGLDYDEKYRNLPYVGILKPSVYSGE